MSSSLLTPRSINRQPSGLTPTSNRSIQRSAGPSAKETGQGTRSLSTLDAFQALDSASFWLHSVTARWASSLFDSWSWTPGGPLVPSVVPRIIWRNTHDLRLPSIDGRLRAEPLPAHALGARLSLRPRPLRGNASKLSKPRCGPRRVGGIWLSIKTPRCWTRQQISSALNSNDRLQ